MANILDRYGIKEVADVTFYEIKDDGTPGAPVIYLDTLKVSTIEQTAENTSARGGKGNPELIMWDYGKEITVTLEDALFSAKSMALMFGDSDFGAEQASIMRTIPKADFASAISSDGTKVTVNGSTFAVNGDIAYYNALGATSTKDAEDVAYATCKLTVDGVEISISSETFPGTYYITGDTYARSETTGKDEFFQFIIQKAKVTSEVTLTMEAEGDPSTFSMNLKVLRPADKEMMKLVKYGVAEESEGE